MKYFAFLFAVAMSVLVTTGTSRADDVASEVIAQSAAPTALTRCSVVSQYGNSWLASVNLYNRSSHALIDASIEYRFFDRDNAQIGQVAYTYTLAQTLSPDDTASVNAQGVYTALSEAFSAVSRVTCKVIGAHFTGRFAWRPGTTWAGGPLRPTPKTKRSSDDGTTSNAETSPDSHQPLRASAAAEHLAFEVINAWNDAVRDGTFVHDTIVLHGGDHDSTVRVTDFVLRLSLANGAKKSYSAMQTAAPQFSRYDVISKTTRNVPQVDPQSDFGKLVSVIVPAHGTATVTLTFQVPDVLADPAANRDVALH